ncbi:adhesion G-protein coupled receptor G6-like [Saccostrea cucullata]|uniref:adhesion G-protein coupled receptor G6-like n=1 Tax=Saccostrea cuccullata TaxID=36930 RepID=UPI002ED38727
MREDILISVVTLVSGFASILGGVALILSHIFVRRLYFVRVLLICLTFADILQASGAVLGTTNYLTLSEQKRKDSNSFCVVQSFITTFSSVSSFIWTTVITIHLFYCFMKQISETKNYTIFLYHVAGWLVPAFISVVALESDKLGRGTFNSGAKDHDPGMISSGQWCWVKVNATEITSTDIAFMFLAGKGWEFATYLIAGAFYIILMVNNYLRRRREDPSLWNSDIVRADDERFCYTPFILYLLRIWGSTRFIFTIIGAYKNQTVDKVDSVLVYFHCIGDSSQAFANFLLFCVFDKDFRKEIYRGCNSRNNNEEGTPLLSCEDQEDETNI